MRSRPRSGTPRIPSEDPDVNRALETMTAPELRAFVRGVLDGLAPGARTGIAQELLARAVKGHAGWKPSRPSRRIVDDAKSFAEAARVVGYADPTDVSEHLRLGGKAFLAGDHATARGVFEALLLPIAAAEIDLGEHELVDEVLAIDAHTCVAQYVTSVYTTTPVSQRADAVLHAMERMSGVSSLLNPIAEMEDVSAGTLPDLAAFLPLWATRLGRFRPAKDERGGQLLDGSALAAQQLGRSDVPRRLEAAWRGAPSLPRLLRWITSAGHSRAARRAKATKALTGCPKTAGRQLGLLRVLVGDLPAAADVLSKAPGLGWSSEDHPGHLMFPLLAVLLANGTARKVSDTLLGELESAGRDVLAAFSEEDADADAKPRLATPSIVALIHDARPGIKVTDADRAVAIGAMRRRSAFRQELTRAFASLGVSAPA